MLKMKRGMKEHIILSSIFSFVVTFAFILHKKIGGLLSGGVYSEPHSWEELIQKAPSFFLVYLFIFFVVFVYMRFNFKNKSNPPEK